MKGKSGAGKEIPKSLDYFNIDNFPELIKSYGNKPNKLIIMFPTNTIEDFFYSEYNVWASKNGSAIKKRQCDGEECCHLIEESINETVYKAGEITKCHCFNEEINDKQKCKSYTGIKAFILNPESGQIISPLCYLFESHSDNSSDNLFTEIDKIRMFTGGKIAKIPFVLSVKMIEKMVTGQKRRFPIWNLQCAITSTENILEYASRLSLPTSNETAVIVSIDESKMIEAPNKSTKTKEDKLQLIRDWLKEMASWGFEESDTGEMFRFKIEKQETINTNAKTTLKTLSAFKDFDGFNNTKELENIKESQLNVVYGKIKTAHKEWKEKFDNSQE